MTYATRGSQRLLLRVVLCLAACGSAPEPPLQTQARVQPVSIPADLAPAFDACPTPRDGFVVIGRTLPPAWSWGEIELLEGRHCVRTEGYNQRTEKLRDADTFQSSKYPLRTYFGALNQQIVDAFNLAYRQGCATGGARCATTAPGPMRPEARFVLLHKGRATAAKTCLSSRTPTLLVHGSMQDANVWLFPGGNDGAGGAFPGVTQKTGLVQHLEAAGRCVYAVTFGNFHGDNFSQAIALANAVARVRQLHRQPDGSSPSVDLIAWSKGALAADVYLSNAASWPSGGTRHPDRLGAAQSAQVPLYRDDVRTYVALSGPHRGLDLNFRHPIHALTIASTPSNAPVGRGPMPWTYFSALQCVTFGPDSPWFDNPYAKSVCERRGGTWLDFFNRIYVSNVTGFDAEGRPRATATLKSLNVAEGVAASQFSFDEYNLSLFGSIDDTGRHVSAYLGQLQAAADLRSDVSIPRRDSSEWKDLDPDEARFFPWVRAKLSFLAGGYLDDPTRQLCRQAAFGSAAPCTAWHVAYNSRHAEASAGLLYKYRLFSGLGMDAAIALGGHFMSRLTARGLDPRLSCVYVLYGQTLGEKGSEYETDAMACPTCSAGSDGVLFHQSIAALAQLTQGWSASKYAAAARQEGVALGHLELGATPAVWDKIVSYFRARD